jgi:hypothetical protein
LSQTVTVSHFSHPQLYNNFNDKISAEKLAPNHYATVTFQHFYKVCFLYCIVRFKPYKNVEVAPEAHENACGSVTLPQVTVTAVNYDEHF